MHWEVWEYKTRNLIATPATEAEALSIVRDLLARGWSADDLSIGIEDATRSTEELPPPLEGDELLARALPSAPGRSAKAS